MYKVKPLIFGNLDKGQDPNGLPFGIKPKTLTADSLHELKEKVWDWQIDNQIGGGNWGNTPVFKNNKLLGYMSYNGRVWNRNIFNADAREIEE